jgi:hypothetical protein
MFESSTCPDILRDLASQEGLHSMELFAVANAFVALVRPPSWFIVKIACWLVGW